MCVLRLGEVGVQLGEPHIGNLAPLAGARFDVAVVLGIQGIFLDALIERDCLLKGFLVTRGPCIFREAVNGKADGVELLTGIERTAQIIHTPEHAAELAVDEVGQKILLGARGSLQILGIAQHTVGSRERPQNTCIEDSTSFGLGMEHALSVDAAIETAVFVVLHFLYPEWQDILAEHLKHFVPQGL